MAKYINKFKNQGEYESKVLALDYPNINYIESGDTIIWCDTMPQAKVEFKFDSKLVGGVAVGSGMSTVLSSEYLNCMKNSSINPNAVKFAEGVEKFVNDNKSIDSPWHGLNLETLPSTMEYIDSSLLNCNTNSLESYNNSSVGDYVGTILYKHEHTGQTSDFNSYEVASGTTSICSGAFKNLRNVNSVTKYSTITIPSTVKYIDSSPMETSKYSDRGTYGAFVSEWVVDSGNTKYSAIDGNLVETDTMTLISLKSATTTDFINPSCQRIPYGIRTIGKLNPNLDPRTSFVANARDIRNIVIPSTVTEINVIACEYYYQSSCMYFFYCPSPKFNFDASTTFRRSDFMFVPSQYLPYYQEYFSGTTFEGSLKAIPSDFYQRLSYFSGSTSSICISRLWGNYEVTFEDTNGNEYTVAYNAATNEYTSDNVTIEIVSGSFYIATYTIETDIGEKVKLTFPTNVTLKSYTGMSYLESYMLVPIGNPFTEIVPQTTNE